VNNVTLRAYTKSYKKVTRNVVAFYYTLTLLRLKQLHRLSTSYDIEDIADEILLMKDGRLIVSGKESNLKKTLTGKTAYIDIRESDVYRYRDKYILSSIRKRKEGELRIKIIGDILPGEAVMTDEISLEDVYLYWMRMKVPFLTAF